MSDDKPSPEPDRVDPYVSGSSQGWAAVGYLIAGMTVWGLVGWLVDRWLHLHGIATAVGIVLGVAGGVVMVVRKIAMPAAAAGPDGREEDGGRPH